MASVKISRKTLKIKNSKLKISSEPVVKNEKFDPSTVAQDVTPRAFSGGLHLWGVFKSFVLVGGDLV
ncbi:MAG: hypothetical protein AAB697_03600 [Patescibacteria group bacterium]